MPIRRWLTLHDSSGDRCHAETRQWRMIVFAAQNDLKEAGPTEKTFYAKLVRAAQDKYKAALGKLKALQTDAELRVCLQ